MSQTPRDPLIGSRLGDYLLQDLIGRGGMARVYRGLDENLGRYAAVKVLETREDMDEVMVNRFKLEARAIARFDHPHIVAVYQAKQEDHLLFIAMKLVEGETLSQMLRRASRDSKPIPPDKIVQVVTQVCSALDYAHARGIVHRDVKPSNILFDADGRAILTDFGLALELGGSTTLGVAFGTPRYISPEQAVSSQHAVPQSDIYSLGVVVFEMLTGRVPFSDESPMTTALYHITDAPPRPRSINADIPVDVEAVVLRALEKAPEDRYPSAGAFAEALRAAYCAAGFDVPGASTGSLALAPSQTVALPGREALPPPTPRRRKAARAAKGDKADKAKQAVTSLTPTRPGGKRRRGLLLGVLGVAAAAIVALFIIRPALAPDDVVSFLGGSGGQTALISDAGLTFDFIYDEDSFTVQNNNDVPLWVNGLIFKRGGEEQFVSFDAVRFGGPIPPGQCAWIRRLSDVYLSPPHGCPRPVYHITMLPDDADLFWQAGADGAAEFRVVGGDAALATCAVDAEECSFTMP